jgi:hypothetical protein
MTRWGIVALTAGFACACALSVGRRNPPAELYRVRFVMPSVTMMGLRTPHNVELRMRRVGVLAEALVRRGFIVVDSPRDADATFSANLDSVIVVDAPQQPRYYFSFELTSNAMRLTWETTFETLDYGARSQAEEQGIAKGVERMFAEWRRSAVRAGVVTETVGRRLHRIPADASWLRQPPRDTSVPGYAFRWATDLGCPNDTCTFGTWLACAAVDVHDAVGTAEPASWRLSRGDRFEAFAGLLLTLQPGEVRVTREIRQGSRADQRIYHAGDTLHLLGQLAGQRFAAIHKDRPVTVDLFWSSKPASNHPVAGELVRADVGERWMFVVNGERTGWILHTPDVHPPDGRTDPRTCPAG